MTESSIPEMSATELKARLDAGDVPVLVDVREPFEARIADLPELGQRRIPTRDFAARLREIEPDRDVVLYCRSGNRSEWAAAMLLQAGYKHVYNLRSGILGWRAEVDPTLTAY